MNPAGLPATDDPALYGSSYVTTDEGRRIQSPAEWLRAGITVESLLFLAILIVAIATRFWDLGSRAMHHD